MKHPFSSFTKTFAGVGSALLLGTPTAHGQGVHESAADTTDRAAVLALTDTVPNTLALPAPLPLFSMRAPGFDGCSPYFMGSYGSQWQLHEGFNAQLGMSIAAGLGKGSPRGVGFGQSVAFAYALPLSARFSFSAGLYAQHMDWGAFRQTDVGLAAALSYKVNDRVTLYGYGTKSLMPQSAYAPCGSFPLFLETVRDRIGGMVEFKVGENSSIGFGVEYQKGPDYDFPCTLPPDSRRPLQRLSER